MTAVFTISASGEHLDASTLALLAEVELDEMSIRALGEDLAVDSDFSFDPQTLSADEPPTVYPWTTIGLLEAAKHLSNCNQCTEDRTAMLASFSTAWQEPSATPLVADEALLDRHLAAALAAFDETVTPVVALMAAKGKQQESAGFLGALGGSLGGTGGTGMPNSGNQTSGVSGWRASGFGRALGLRRNQVLIGFAALAVPLLLLQLRPTEQFGGSAMKAADTTASAAEETTAAAAEFGADNQVLAETTAAAAAETMAASADAVAGFTTDTLSRIPAAELNQALETTPALPPGPLAGGGVASEGSGNLSQAAVAETEAAAAPVDNEPADKAVLSTTPPPAAPPQRPRATIAAPAAAAPLASPLPITPTTAAPISNSAKTQLRSKDVSGAVAGARTDAATSPAPSAVAKPTPKPAAKAKKSRATATRAATRPAITAAPAAPAAAATATAAPGQLFVTLDPSVVNLGNLGAEADPAALMSRFRTAYDRVRPQSPATVALSPAAAATSVASVPVAPAPAAAAPPVSPAPAPAASPAAAPAPAVAVSADPVFADGATTSTLAPQSVERCVSSLFGANDRRILAAAIGTVANRTVWIIRVESATGTVDVIANAASCAELLRQPVP